MSISVKLQSIVDSKAAIKAAIVAKGVAVSDSDALNTYAAKIGSIVAGSSGETAFAKFLDGQLQTITPEDVTGMQKLQGLMLQNTPFTSIELSNTCTSIDAYGFYNMPGLTTVTIPSSVTTIGGGSFAATPKLKTVYIKRKSGQSVPDGQPWDASTDVEFIRVDD